MVLVIQSVRVGEAGVVQSQSVGFFVHEFHKPIHSAAHVLSDCQGGVVGRFEKHRMEQIVNRPNLSGHQVDLCFPNLRRNLANGHPL